MKCGLCTKEKDLKNSHIIPEFLYKPLYDENHRAMGVHGLGKNKWQYLQKGLRESLLCCDCEQLLNKNYEQYFFNFWIENRAIPSIWPGGIHTVAGIDYIKFKLFHLSILFRASISTLPTFDFISLGPHENKIREMIINGDPGLSTRYHIFAYAVIKKEKSLVQQLITRPIKSNIEGHTVYSLMFSGCMWNYLISNHASPKMEKVALTKEGKMHLTAVQWEKLPIIKVIKDILYQ